MRLNDWNSRLCQLCSKLASGSLLTVQFISVWVNGKIEKLAWIEVIMQSLFTMLTFFYSGLELDLSHTLLHTTRRERTHLSPCLWLNQKLPPLFWQLLALLCSDFYQSQRLKDTFQLLEIDFSNRETLSTFRWAKQRAGVQASISGFLVQRYSMNPSEVPDRMQCLLPLPHSRFVPFLPTSIRTPHKKYKGEGLILPICILLSNVSHLHFMALLWASITEKNLCGVDLFWQRFLVSELVQGCLAHPEYQFLPQAALTSLG